MIEHQYARYQQRRATLRSRLSTPGTIFICAALEPHVGRFRQDSSFYYFTGLQEPGAVLVIEPSGKEILFVPNYNGVRAQWVASELTTDAAQAKEIGVDEICYQGGVERGYALTPFQHDGQYEHLLSYVRDQVGPDDTLHVLGGPAWQGNYGQQLLWYLHSHIPHLQKSCADMRAVVGKMRRIKDAYEVDCIKKAIAITATAQRSAHHAIKADAYEYEVRGAIEHMFVKHGSPYDAFASIVATGKNATVLHYLDCTKKFAHGEAVVVDIGATYNGYASDITRTYSVGGTYSPRQRELYTLVLEAQQYIADIVRPGFYLNNPDEQEKSLNHLVRALYKKYDLEKYMPHGIGHYMGLDVHDVGNGREPLEPGDVITIEPGLYLSDEEIGIRIEDDYLITADGAQCLSPQIPKELVHIEG